MALAEHLSRVNPSKNLAPQTRLKIIRSVEISLIQDFDNKRSGPTGFIVTDPTKEIFNRPIYFGEKVELPSKVGDKAQITIYGESSVPQLGQIKDAEILPKIVMRIDSFDVDKNEEVHHSFVKGAWYIKPDGTGDLNVTKEVLDRENNNKIIGTPWSFNKNITELKHNFAKVATIIFEPETTSIPRQLLPQGPTAKATA
jgi:hypothetical protein